jgi:hypothetical protein
MIDDLISFAVTHPVPVVIVGALIVLLCFAGIKPWRAR